MKVAHPPNSCPGGRTTAGPQVGPAGPTTMAVVLAIQPSGLPLGSRVPVRPEDIALAPEANRPA